MKMKEQLILSLMRERIRLVLKERAPQLTPQDIKNITNAIIDEISYASEQLYASNLAAKRS